MSFFSGRLILAVALAALGWGGRTAHAQTAPVTYWTPLFGFGGALSEGQNATTYGNLIGPHSYLLTFMNNAYEFKVNGKRVGAFVAIGAGATTGPSSSWIS